ncbi:MAG: thiamine-phosphate kinase [Vicinamibacterales bacterium]
MSSPANRAAPQPGERALIDHIRRRLPAPPPALVIGAGDDAAVIVPERGALQVLTTDAIVEGVHFDRRFSSLSDIGYKALAVNVSDIAAMGARPEFALLSLILPDGFTLADLDALLDGLLEMAAASKVALAGGNISRSPGPLIVDMTVTGSVRPRRILTRSGGRPGDALYVTGSVGGAAAGLDVLRVRGSEGPKGPDLSDVSDLIKRHQRPEPRIRIGLLLGRNRAASACMDLSDGLADAVRQIAEASGTGATVDAAALPLDPAAAAWFESAGTDPVLASVSGGDDYELLFAVPRKARGRLRTVESLARGVPITHIGELTADPAIQLVRRGTGSPMPEGFSHFHATNR